MLHKEYDHIILLAHGSPDPLWKAPFESLHSQVIQRYNTQSVSLAYMELTAPTLEETVASLSGDIKKIAVLPLFLAVGRHLRQDVPEQIRALQTDSVSIELLPPIGDDEIIKKAMLETIAHHLGKE